MVRNCHVKNPVSPSLPFFRFRKELINTFQMCTKDTGVRLLLALTWILSKNVQLRCLLLTALEEAEDESSGLSLNRTDMTPQTRSSQREVEDVGRHWRWLRGRW